MINNVKRINAGAMNINAVLSNFFFFFIKNLRVCRFCGLWLMRLQPDEHTGMPPGLPFAKINPVTAHTVRDLLLTASLVIRFLHL